MPTFFNEDDISNKVCTHEECYTQYGNLLSEDFVNQLPDKLTGNLEEWDKFHTPYFHNTQAVRAFCKANRLDGITLSQSICILKAAKRSQLTKLKGTQL